MKPTEWHQGERGSQLVELALILPLLLFLALLVSEGALVLRAHIVINNAAREGARYAAQPGNNCSALPSPGPCISNIQQAVINYAASNGITLTAGNVALVQGIPVASTPLGFTASQVSVTYIYPLIYLPPLATAFFGGPAGATGVPLFGVAEFRNFY